MNIDRRILIGVVCGLSLAGCEHSGGLDVALGADPTWGEANRQTMAAQVVDPEPDYTWDEMETSADHSSQAIGRYLRDAVKQPDRVKTTSRIQSRNSD